MSRDFDPDIAKRLKAKTSVTTRTSLHARGPCWEWDGHRRGGYGIMQVRGKPERTHRIAYFLFVAPIPEGLDVCHHCDNPACVNPEHLFVGTQGDNNRDRHAKGRDPVIPRGIEHPQAKLTDDQVLEIRALRAASVPRKDIATRFGINVNYVSDIALKRKRAEVAEGDRRSWSVA